MSQEIKSARFVLLEDLNNCQDGDSVRITGIWDRYDEKNKVAIVEYDNSEAEIDPQNLSSLPQKGELVQVLGEITEVSPFGTTRIKARIVRSVGSLDMEMYIKVVELRNNTL